MSLKIPGKMHESKSKETPVFRMFLEPGIMASITASMRCLNLGHESEDSWQD